MTGKNYLALAIALGISAVNALGQTATDTRLDPEKTAAAARLRVSETTQRHRKPHIRGDYRVAGRHRTTNPGRAPSATPTIHANIIDCQPEGIYTFSPTGYGFTPVVTGSEFSAGGGSACANGTFYAINSDTRQAYSWNTDDWTLTSGPVASELVHGTAMAANPSDGTIYSCAYDILGQGYELVTVDPVEFVRTSTIGTINRYLAAIFFDLQGNLLGFDGDGKLYEINRDNATLTLKGDTGISALFNGAAVVDPASGVCFYAVCDWDCSLYEVDLATCLATHLYDFAEEEEIASIFILPEAPDPGAPSKATNLTAGFTGGSLGGTVAFTAPATTHSGTAGTGPLTYTLTCNDAVVKTGGCGWGADVSVPYTASAPGMHSFVLTLSNDAGAGRPCGTSLWIGHDTPSAPAGVQAIRDGQTNNISWKAPAAGVHGGYVDFSRITYRVTRNPGNTVVADNITETSYADAIPDGNVPVSYHYEVQALYNGLYSETSRSNQVMVGAVYHNSFDNREQFDEFTSTSMAYNGPEWEFSSWFKAAGVGYNEEGAVSAWLSSPAVTLSSADTYTLSFDTWCSNDSYNETLSVFIAGTDKPAQLYNSAPLIDKMTVNWGSDAKKTITAEFRPQTDGTHYITFNGCSGIDLGTLYIDNVLLYRNSVLPLPSAPAVRAEIMGGTMAMVTVTAPLTDTDGATLESIDRIVVSIGDNVIHTIDAPVPGETYNFICTFPDADTFYISAVAYTEAGPSAPGTYFVSRIDAAKPRQAHITSITERENSGEVTLTWEAPATDLNNNPIKEGTLTYTIYADGETEPVATAIAANTHTWQAVAPGEQKFKSFYVVASNEAGSSQPSKQTEPAPFGAPDTAPYAESFAAMQTSGLWDFYNEDDYSEGVWLLVGASETPAAAPVDNDGGMLAFSGEFLDDTAWATSGKIDLGQGDNPRLSLWYFAQNSREGKDRLDIMVNDGSGYKTLDSFTMRDEKRDGWVKRVVSLAAYSGKIVSLRLVGTSARTSNFMLIDKIEISSIDNDLAATAITAPASAILGRTFDVEAVVTNNGSATASDYKAALYRNGAKVAEQAGQPIASGAAQVYRFGQTPDASWDATAAYRVEITYAPDQISANNVSQTVNVAIIHNNHPAVETIAATYTGSDRRAVEVKWEAPDLINLPTVEYTENFECYSPFRINPDGDWTFIDVDGAETYGSSLFPYDGMLDPKAFVVFDANHFNISYAAHSGSLYLASISSPSARSDDWMISPELTGEAQTVRLFARSYSDTYGLESFRIMASSTGCDTESFNLIEAHDNVPVDWTEYSATLPAGTRYFAINCVSDNVFAFFIDDITFTPLANPAANFAIMGYNIYRNGVRINDSPVNALSFTDHAVPSSAPGYAVSVVYDHGESPLSKTVIPGESSIDPLPGETVTVRAVEGGIEIIGRATRAAIYAADGRAIHTEAVDSHLFVRTNPGVYIVAIPGHITKVIVK